MTVARPITEANILENPAKAAAVEPFVVVVVVGVSPIVRVT